MDTDANDNTVNRRQFLMVQNNIREPVSFIFHSLQMRCSLLLFSVRNKVGNISNKITHGALILQNMIIRWSVWWKRMKPEKEKRIGEQ